MIPQAAIKAYLNGKREDHRWVKKLAVPALDDALRTLRPAPRLHPILRQSQKACFYLGVAYPRFGFYIDMGGGKTLLALELLRYWYKNGFIRRALVTVKTDKAFFTWERQFHDYEIDVPYLILDEGNTERKWKHLRGFDSGIVIVARPALAYMATEKIKKKNRPGKQFALRADAVEELRQYSEGFVIDESTDIGYHTSLAHKLAYRLSKCSYCCYGLAGRPFGRNPELLWGEQLVVDNGLSLGETLGLFRAAFCTEQENPWDKRGFKKDYVFKQSMVPQLRRLVQHRSIIYEPGECVDLPKCVPIIEEVRLPAETEAYCDRIIQQMKAARGSWREINNAFMQMRQLSSGFIGFKDDETGDRAQVEFGANPKFERLTELVEEVPEDRKVLIFYDFTYSGRKIYNALKQHGAIWLWSGAKSACKDLQRFFENPQCRIAVAQNRVGAFSLDELKVANYVFMYETAVAVLDRQQAERRALRPGQKYTVFQWDLVVRGTYDRHILQFHKEGGDLYKALARGDWL